MLGRLEIIAGVIAGDLKFCWGIRGMGNVDSTQRVVHPEIELQSWRVSGPSIRDSLQFQNDSLQSVEAIYTFKAPDTEGL